MIVIYNLQDVKSVKRYGQGIGKIDFFGDGVHIGRILAV
jgi:hypothetical protein